MSGTVGRPARASVVTRKTSKGLALHDAHAARPDRLLQKMDCEPRTLKNYLIFIFLFLLSSLLLSACKFERAATPSSLVTPVTGVIPTATPVTLSRVTPTIPATPAAEPSPPIIPTWQPQEPYIGIWISGDELAGLPTNGPGWDNVWQAAQHDTSSPQIRDQSDQTDVYVMAKALVYARTGLPHYREEVIETIVAAMGTEQDGRTLALGRNLVAYVIAADLINLPAANTDVDERFQDWLRDLLTKTLRDKRTLQQTHEQRPNNWGTHAGASRVAVAVYLQDSTELERAATVFKGWLGDRSAYSGFKYGSLTWQADPDSPVGINPVGATKEGHYIDGALPEEMRRGGKFRWPPKVTGYAWEGLQGAIVQAEILSQAGYPAWEWEDRALLRAVQFLYDIDWQAEGDDQWQIWLINYVYGTNFPTISPVTPGKNVGWTDWTHQSLNSTTLGRFRPDRWRVGNNRATNAH